jgi:transposase-like protein
MKNSFRYFNSSPEVIRLTVMMYIRYPLSLRQVEDLLGHVGLVTLGLIVALGGEGRTCRHHGPDFRV